MLVEANSETFNEAIKHGTVLVKFSTPWCIPCKKLNPILQEMADDGLNIVLVDIDDSPELADEFEVMSVPTIVLFKDGEMDNRSMGFMSRTEIERHFFGL